MSATADISGWIGGRLPEEWFAGEPAVTVDREEIGVLGTLPAVEGGAEAEQGRIARFRDETREQRIRIAREAEQRFGRKVAWGATCGEVTQLFTTLSVPVMTRLRQRERIVLDTLVDAGVARSRSEALAWCVRLVGQHTGDGLDELRTAMKSVQDVRDRGPHDPGAPDAGTQDVGTQDVGTGPAAG
jgi:hypothetical protein